MNNTLATLLENPQELHRRLQPAIQHLPDITSVVLVIAIAHISAIITWMLVTDPDQAPLTPQPIAATAAPAMSDQQAIRQLTSAHLFGIMGQPSKTMAAAPETRLNLVLKGILADDPGKLATAIISQGKGGNEDIYSLGDTLPGGATIKEIHAEHILIERQGQLETLRLPRDSELDSIQLPSKTTSAPSQSNAMPGGPSLNDIRNSIMQNPVELTKYALPIVARENGKQVGYRLKANQDASLIEAMGIEPNDIVTSINGIKLDNPKNSMQALQQLKTATSVSLVVLRNGREVPLNIQLQ